MCKILLVEDDTFSQALVQHHLGKAGHRVIATDSAEGALAILDEKSVPDMAVLDVSLPGIDGRELAKILRKDERTKDVKIIFLSGAVDPWDIAASEDVSNAYLTKPFVASALMATIDRLQAAVDAQQEDGW